MAERQSTIWIQQDNASSHFRNDDAVFANAVEVTGLDIKLYFQPANSPDLNVLDLGFFNSLQSTVNKETVRNKGELIEKVNMCFDVYPHYKINNVFLSLQKAMEQVILCYGGNNYELQHMNKAQLERTGSLPTSIKASENVLAIMMGI